MKNKFVLAVALVLLAMMFAACGGGSSLVGKWVSEEGQNVSDDSIEKIELSKDGTGIIDGYSVTWKAEKGRLTVKVDVYGVSNSIAYDYKVTGSTLILTDDDGESTTFTKK